MPLVSTNKIPITGNPLIISPRLNIPLVNQIGKNWCWAACAEMIHSHFSSAPAFSQCDLASNALSASGCVTACSGGSIIPSCDKPLADEDITKLLAGCINTMSVNFSSNGPLGYTKIQTEISSNRPIQMGLNSGNDIGHVVLIIDIQMINNRWALIVNDPAMDKKKFGVIFHGDLMHAGIGPTKWDASWLFDN